MSSYEQYTNYYIKRQGISSITALSTTEQRTWGDQYYQYSSCYFNSIAKEGISNILFLTFTSNSNSEYKCQGDPSLNKKPLLKRQGFTIQDPLNERPLKKRLQEVQVAPHRDNNCDRNMGWMRREIASIKETVEEMASEAREERDNLQSVLADILAEVQDWDH